MSATDLKRVTKAILKIGEDPIGPGCRKLTGRDGWRTRAGNFRVLYDIDETKAIVTVMHIGHRRDVYR